MSNIVISAEHLTKKYDLGVIGTGSFRRDFSRWWAQLHGKPDPNTIIGKPDYGNRNGESILALDDVNFTVEQGEVLGIIGKNGAGKSTLLKILSQVTAPTEGKVKIKGRIGSLLEVGTGFHPELTGRENVYLNGAILGMSRREVNKKFDEIVDFSGVEKYIDTPVKRYSSGMHVRLAFAVAAHLDPEILIVDEVLAVGDAEFQKKCLGKMGDVAGEGRTVLFVSHNMGAISSLCKKAILISNGRKILESSVDEVISKYINRENQKINGEKTVLLKGHPNRVQGSHEYLTRFCIDNLGNSISYHGEPINFVLEYDFPESIKTPQFSIIINTFSGMKVFSLISDYQNNDFPTVLVGKGEVVCKIAKLPLMPGTYSVNLRLWQPGEKLDDIENIYNLQVEWLDRNIGQFNWNMNMGVVYIDANWNVKK